MVSELKDEPTRARPDASVQQPCARKLASAPVADNIAGADGDVVVEMAACVEIEEVVGRVEDVEEISGGSLVLEVDFVVVEVDDEVGEGLPPAALAWYIFRRRPAPHV